MLKLIVDLADYEGPVYTGREKASKIRQELDLDKYDRNVSEVHIIVPDSTYTISSSYFMGLLSPSVVYARSREKFYEKYKISSPVEIKLLMDGFVARAIHSDIKPQHWLI